MDKKLTEQQAAVVVEKLREATRKNAWRLTVNTDRKPGLCDTKFGGIPYWDAKQEYPELIGQPLVLLAQINLRDLGKNEYLPDCGLLQFFILPDDMYGCDFDKPDSNDTFRVVYHAEIDPVVTAEDVLALGILTTATAREEDECCMPICGMGEIAVDVQKTVVSMGVECYEYDSMIAGIAGELGINVPEHPTAYSLLPEKLFDAEFDQNTGHWLFGYPYFTQYDPRECSEELQRYDTMLFQMDSDFPSGSNYQILWGDCGVANFFINSDDLRRLDFSRVMYTWDCC